MQETSHHIRWPLRWAIVFAAHLVLATLIWWLLPHGFSWTHPRFWVNEVFPFALAGLAIVGLLALHRRRVAGAQFAMACCAATYLAMAVAWFAVFPRSGLRPAAVAALIGASLLFACFRAVPCHAWRNGAAIAGAIIGLLLGGLLPLSQRGANPATSPAEPYRELPSRGDASDAKLEIPEFVSLLAHSGQLLARFGDVAVSIEPRLEFISRSPDQCWTLLANRRDRFGPQRHYAGASQTDGVTTFCYAGQEPSILRVFPANGDVVRFEALSALPRPAFSHLNTFCRMRVHGHKRLALSFSPCPEDKLDVTAFQYPAGRPLRFAYLGPDGIFRVVQATSGEKGPFHELAHGTLAREQPLTITLHDGDRPIGRITLIDFAAQASTQISPTAGWGVPENAVEFALHDDHPDSAAEIFLTLAGTSVGRGFDSVGHAAGVYHNRLEIERIRTKKQADVSSAKTKGNVFERFRIEDNCIYRSPTAKLKGHLTAYEQVSFPPGKKMADYCLPCQLVAARAARLLQR